MKPHKLVILVFCTLVFLDTKVFAQEKISEAEYKVYNAVLKEIFVHRGYEVEHLPKEHTIIHVNDFTYNRLLVTPMNYYAVYVSDTCYKKFEKLNEQKYPLNKKKITVQVNSKFKQFDIDFSRCYIEKDDAIVFVGILYAPLNSEGAVYILKHNKTTRTWEVVKKIRKWAS
ncbi:MAG TPA: hypothetical protein VNX01_12285 [Bacteroidia bacterium]|nr:hypothetical protein [Bacteroidia bacterium]